ncbi:MAG: TIGR03915 family putative DNA repair protein [Clostridia bacterium]|nr:TIGR03915 family putative DNA repair protein [Clostridia bacterium]
MKHKLCINYIKRILEVKRDIACDFGDAVVADFEELKNRVLYEAHRFKGFLRFSETESGVLYAHFSPDHDVGGLILPHFISRLKNEAFVIYDEKRNKAFAYDGKKAKCFTPNYPISLYLSGKEEEFRALWQEYFDAVNIPSRKNTRQQDRFLPRRYRKSLTEFGK